MCRNVHGRHEATPRCFSLQQSDAPGEGVGRTGTAFRKLILAIVVGGSSLVAAATVFFHREVAVLISAAAGLIFAG